MSSGGINGYGETRMTSAFEEFKEPVEAKKKKLEARVLGLKADASDAARKRADEIEAELDDVRAEIRDGWVNHRKDSIAKLNNWLAD